MNFKIILKKIKIELYLKWVMLCSVLCRGRHDFELCYAPTYLVDRIDIA